MSIRIRCTTTVDITATGVKNRFYKSQMPFLDFSGQLIDSESAWHAARARQSNWETVNQLISLRTLTDNISLPVKDGSCWHFEFDVVNPAAVNDGIDAVGLLKLDFNGVPVLDDARIDAVTTLKTADCPNCWFEIVY